MVEKTDKVLIAPSPPQLDKDDFDNTMGEHFEYMYIKQLAVRMATIFYILPAG